MFENTIQELRWFLERSRKKDIKILEKRVLGWKLKGVKVKERPYSNNDPFPQSKV
jgi:hypothetical protein